MQVDIQDIFCNEILDKKNSPANIIMFSKERIYILIRRVKQAKDASKPSCKERTLLMQYTILTTGTLERLLKRKHRMVSAMLFTVCQKYLAKTLLSYEKDL